VSSHRSAERLRSRRLHRFHFLFDPLCGSSPQPNHLGDLQDANAFFELLLCRALQGYIDFAPSKPGTLSNSTFEPRLDAAR
jgi:hypothetical protein